MFFIINNNINLETENYTLTGQHWLNELYSELHLQDAVQSSVVSLLVPAVLVHDSVGFAVGHSVLLVSAHVQTEADVVVGTVA